jgi:hypothetical protein
MFGHTNSTNVVPMRPLSGAGKDESCPACGAVLIPIRYGLPGPKMREQARRGEIQLGGCVIREDDPQFRCRGAKPHIWWRGPDDKLVAQSGTTIGSSRDDEVW